MQAKKRWMKSILDTASQVESKPLPWTRGATRQAMTPKRRAIFTASKTA